MKKIYLEVAPAAFLVLAFLIFPLSFAETPVSLNFNLIPLYNQGTCPFLSPLQLRTAYNFTQLYAQGINGAGESIAIVDAHGAAGLLQSLSTFDNAYGLPPLSLGSNLFIIEPYGAPTVNYSNWTRETTLDVEVTHSLAPGAKIYLVITPDSSSLLNAVNYTVNNLPVNAISISWGAPEGEYSSSSLSEFNSIFQNAYDKGINVFAASGDSGAYNGGNSLSVNFPASSPNVISVGGTVLSVSSSGGYISETAWNDSGGGESGFFARPVFQPPLSSYREVPDVSFNAGTPICAYINASWEGLTGTSMGAPAWSALSSLIEQKLSTNIQLLPSLYEVFQTAPSFGFHLIDSGCNGFYCANGNYSMVTGIGSPIAYPLVQILAKTSYQIPFLSNAEGAIFEVNGKNYTTNQTLNLTFGEKINLVVYNLSLGDIRYIEPKISGLVSSSNNQASFFVTSPGEIYINFTPQVEVMVKNYDANSTLINWINKGGYVNYAFPLNYSTKGERYTLRGIEIDNSGIIYSNVYSQAVFYPINITLLLNKYSKMDVTLYGPIDNISAEAVYYKYIPLSNQESVHKLIVTNGTQIFYASNTSVNFIPIPERQGDYLIDGYNLTNFIGSQVSLYFYRFLHLTINFISLSGDQVSPSSIALSGAIEFNGSFWSLPDQNITIYKLYYNKLNILTSPVKLYTYSTNLTIHVNATNVYVTPSIYLVPLPFERVDIHIENSTLSNTTGLLGRAQFTNLPAVPYSISFSFAGQNYTFSNLRGEYQSLPVYPNNIVIYLIAGILVIAAISFVVIEKIRKRVISNHE
ncbi:MAG: S53 family peptidase [Candidatus Acidifodinimicrobium sp.]